MELTDIINFQQEINSLINLCIDNIQYEKDPIINKKIKLLNQVMCYFNRMMTISENIKDSNEENSDTCSDITISDIQDEDIDYNSPTCLSDDEDYSDLFVDKIYHRQVPNTIHSINQKVLGLDKLDEEILENTFGKENDKLFFEPENSSNEEIFEEDVVEEDIFETKHKNSSRKYNTNNITLTNSQIEIVNDNEKIDYDVLDLSDIQII
ncbi:hypothetical protein H012_gp697 [Acanthamoeba polyphaga moumouvirus]|uniref:Uncharacterized protein n=2 Tax=Moumouvirus TaxID=3080801 RepID=L7RCN2_9VIRU|nr:hypothetical protein H012_gp697 [Acanthamoeba polyphaga moumouvirus]AEX63049.1 hypothetical protein mv_R847 [Moumouvirus Monve]AGC01768.1 hypothetical protein Moumou_00224 [Acanthamoeba polyphaga moumouvirus]AQN68117.1 hypothetical protein [Saudi moumouvirus]